MFTRASACSTAMQNFLQRQSISSLTHFKRNSVCVVKSHNCRQNTLVHHVYGVICLRPQYYQSIPKHFASQGKGCTDSKKKKLKETTYRRVYLTCLACTTLAIWYLSMNYKKKKESRETAIGKTTDICKTERYVDPDISKNAKMIKYKDTLLPIFVDKQLQTLESLPVDESDIFVVSFPKSGTTWVQEVVFLLYSHLDVHRAKQNNMEERFPYLEFIYPGVQEVMKRPAPRLLKSHLPHHLLPEELRQGKGKVVYIARNPKDVSVSYYHYIRMLSEVSYKGTFEQFFLKFINDKVAYGPWWKHVRDFWVHRKDENILFITYEEMHKNPVDTVLKISRFLGKAVDEHQAVHVARYCSFNNMKKNPAANYSWWDDLGMRNKGETDFLRKGKVGDWKNYYSAEMSQRVDAICKEKLEPFGLYFCYEL